MKEEGGLKKGLGQGGPDLILDQKEKKLTALPGLFRGSNQGRRRNQKGPRWKKLKIPSYSPSN